MNLTWPFIHEKNVYGQQDYLYLVATDNYNVRNISCLLCYIAYIVVSKMHSNEVILFSYEQVKMTFHCHAHMQ